MKNENQNVADVKPCGSCELITGSSKRIRKGSDQFEFPDHAASKRRINRVSGQLNAISRMIDEREYCPDIIQQIRAATSALRSLEAEVLKRHLAGCVRNAFRANDPSDANDKIEEILRLLK